VSIRYRRFELRIPPPAVVAVAAALVLLVALGLAVMRPVCSYRVTAYFPKSIGLHRGPEVALPGLNVGTIRSLDPQ